MRKRGQVIARVGRIVARIGEEKAQIARKHIRHDAFALDEAGVAVGRFLRRPPPVEEHDGAPALQQVKRRRYAHHAGTKNDHVGFHAVATPARTSASSTTDSIQLVSFCAARYGVSGLLAEEVEKQPRQNLGLLFWNEMSAVGDHHAPHVGGDALQAFLGLAASSAAFCSADRKHRHVSFMRAMISRLVAASCGSAR